MRIVCCNKGQHLGFYVSVRRIAHIRDKCPSSSESAVQLIGFSSMTLGTEALVVVLIPEEVRSCLGIGDVVSHGG
jgi:hypothetical protein